MSRNSFTLDTILKDSRQSLAQIKEAQVQEKNAGANDDSTDFGAILDTLTGEKTASLTDASTELGRDELQALLQQKIAALAGVNQSAMLKEAQLIGAAIHDGYLARASESEYHAAKIAQVMELEDPDLEKIASEIGFNEGVKIAMAIAEQEIVEGQKLAAAQLEQLKEASYQVGHIDTLSWLSGLAG